MKQSSKRSSVPMSVIIPTYKRVDQLEQAINNILKCDPAPDEILIHVDAGDVDTAQMLERTSVSWFQSSVTQGPGGGRNLLTQRAKHEYLVSFDDDSWPLESDFFEVAYELLQGHDELAVIGARIIDRRGEVPTVHNYLCEVSSYEGCGCVYRKSAFLETNGYLNLRYAYGMEERDVAMQLIDRGWRLAYAPHLPVYHDTDRSHEAHAKVNAAHVRNAALLVFLRYPLGSQWQMIVKVAARVLYALKKRRYSGILEGVLSIPLACIKFRSERDPIGKNTAKQIRRIAVNPCTWDKV